MPFAVAWLGVMLDLWAADTCFVPSDSKRAKRLLSAVVFGVIVVSVAIAVVVGLLAGSALWGIVALFLAGCTALLVGGVGMVLTAGPGSFKRFLQMSFSPRR